MEDVQNRAKTGVATLINDVLTPSGRDGKQREIEHAIARLAGLLGDKIPPRAILLGETS